MSDKLPMIFAGLGYMSPLRYEYIQHEIDVERAIIEVAIVTGWSTEYATEYVEHVARNGRMAIIDVARDLTRRAIHGEVINAVPVADEGDAETAG